MKPLKTSTKGFLQKLLFRRKNSYYKKHRDYNELVDRFKTRVLTQ